MVSTHGGFFTKKTRDNGCIGIENVHIGSQDSDGLCAEFGLRRNP